MTEEALLYIAPDEARPLNTGELANRQLYVEGLHKIEGINRADELLRRQVDQVGS